MGNVWVAAQLCAHRGCHVLQSFPHGLLRVHESSPEAGVDSEGNVAAEHLPRLDLKPVLLPRGEAVRRTEVLRVHAIHARHAVAKVGLRADLPHASDGVAHLKVLRGPSTQRLGHVLVRQPPSNGVPARMMNGTGGMACQRQNQTDKADSLRSVGLVSYHGCPPEPE